MTGSQAPYVTRSRTRAHSTCMWVESHMEMVESALGFFGVLPPAMAVSMRHIDCFPPVLLSLFSCLLHQLVICVLNVWVHG